jgi:predicted amidohydrolase YtcJ
MQAGREKRTLLRSEIFYTLEWPADLDRALNEIPYYSDEFIRFAGYKLLIDGQFPTWYTHEPDPGIRWNMPTWDKRIFKKTIKTLHKTGLQISIHCGGDAAVDLTLEAYEDAMNSDPRPDPRHRIEHASLTKPHATKKAADLGVIISCQPQFLRFSPGLVGKLGEERAGRIIVTREWLDAGITLALGSDTPSSPWHQPQATLMGAVTRLGPDDISYHPEQAMTIQEALYAHSMGSAKAAFEENVKGSLTPGKYADITVWDNDFITIDPMSIGDVVATLTMVGGKVVYQLTT